MIISLILSMRINLWLRVKITIWMNLLCSIAIIWKLLLLDLLILIISLISLWIALIEIVLTKGWLNLGMRLGCTNRRILKRLWLLLNGLSSATTVIKSVHSLEHVCAVKTGVKGITRIQSCRRNLISQSSSYTRRSADYCSTYTSSYGSCSQQSTINLRIRGSIMLRLWL